jgi:hypothetical protein
MEREEDEGPKRGADTSDAFLDLASPAPAAAAAPPTAPPPPPVLQLGHKRPFRSSSHGHPPLQKPARVLGLAL